MEKMVGQDPIGSDYLPANITLTQFSFKKNSKRTVPHKTPIQATLASPSTVPEIVWSPNELGDPSQTPTDLDRKPSLVRSFREGSTSSSFGLPIGNLPVSRDQGSDPLGLTVVHEPETTPTLDIIFVHGLGGTSRATWARGRDPRYFWPEKWLPLEPGIRMARILSFGYNASWATPGPAPITGIADFAKDLLFSMKFAKSENLEELELGQVTSRIPPILFLKRCSHLASLETHYLHCAFHGGPGRQTGIYHWPK
jgi:hypothetical protein